MRPCNLFATLTLALSVHANTGNIQNPNALAARPTVGGAGNEFNTNGFAKHGTGQRAANQKSGPAGRGPSNRAAHRACHRRGGKLVPHGAGRRQGGKLMARAAVDDDDDAKSCVTDDGNSGYYQDFDDLPDGGFDDPGTDTEPTVVDK